MGQREALAALAAPGELHPVAPGGPARGPLDASPPRTARLGLYVHVPFCAARCPYCSFATAPHGAEAFARYRRALAREIDLLGEAGWASAVTLDSVFLGGGTPSLLDPAGLAAILDRVRRRFTVAPGAEITVECNPESVTREKLAAYRAAGVNRVSLGVQSLDDAVLVRLGRLHSAAGAEAAFAAARAAGLENVSVDLMYGLPGLDTAAWERTVRSILAWAPDHLSAYGLALDEGSAWGAQGPGGLPPEETVVRQYWALAAAAARAGLEHYEISNYARPGFRARHNLAYWHAGEYLACGPSAAGHLGDVRYTNARAVARYCAAVEAGRLPIESWERLSEGQRRGERLILGLRLADGVPAAWLAERAAGDDRLRDRLAAWRTRGLLGEADGRARLTEAGFLLSDALFVELL